MNIITFNNHQLNKAIFIKKNLDNDLKIFHKSSNNHKSNCDIKYIENLNQVTKLCDHSNIYLFFVLYFNQEMWELFSHLNKKKSKIVLIEETHNMLMHPYKIPGINLTPDLILAASDSEQKAIQDFYNLDDDIVLNSGWIFQSQYFDLIESSHQIESNFEHLKKSSKTKILIYLAAPIYISANSIEDNESRLSLVNYLNKKYPYSVFFIKPHPLEKKDQFKKMLIQKNIDFIFLKENSLSKNNMNMFDLIISSAYSQCTVDNIIQDLPLLIYAFKEENFITKSFYFKYVHPTHTSLKNDLRVSEIYKGKFLSEIEKFKEKNIGTEQKSLLLFKDKLYASEIEFHDRSTELELMAYLLNESNGLPVLLSDKCPDRMVPIKNLFLQPEEFDINRIDFAQFTYPEKMYSSAIIWRKILEGSIISNSQIKFFLEEIFNSSFGLFFIRESIVFKYFLIANNMFDLISQEQNTFFNKVDLIISDRLIFGNALLGALEFLLSTRFNFFNKILYRLLFYSSKIFK